MASVAVGIFDSRDQAERSAQELRNKGFDKEISVVTRDANRDDSSEPSMRHDDSTMDGVTTGGALGGIAGLAAGAGALFIPGIGPLLAAGPIAGLLSGAVTGGVAGGLIDWGIPAEESRHYEEDVKQGRTLVAAHASGPKLDDAANLLRRHGAHDVKTY
ncbi:MAG: hypothetical protein DDT35_01495 [Firmicutes bacterium]|nr:hypothetical protein [Bacillota bacterium]